VSAQDDDLLAASRFGLLSRPHRLWIVLSYRELHALPGLLHGYLVLPIVGEPGVVAPYSRHVSAPHEQTRRGNLQWPRTLLLERPPAEHDECRCRAGAADGRQSLQWLRVPPSGLRAHELPGRELHHDACGDDQQYGHDSRIAARRAQ